MDMVNKSRLVFTHTLCVDTEMKFTRYAECPDYRCILGFTGYRQQISSTRATVFHCKRMRHFACRLEKRRYGNCEISIIILFVVLEFVALPTYDLRLRVFPTCRYLREKTISHAEPIFNMYLLCILRIFPVPALIHPIRRSF